MGEGTVRIYLLSIFVFVTCLTLLTGAALAEGTTIAFFTLNQTATDLTGLNGDANILNAPYEDGGVYLNGKYVGSDPDGSMVQTPYVTLLDFAAMSVRVDFKVSEWPSFSRPILFCGPNWRWMGASMTTGGEVYLSYNGTVGPGSIEPVSLDVWHTLAMVYDGTTGHLILDGVEVASKDFIPTHGNDRKFVTHNGGYGTSFKGHVRNLVVYNGVVQFVTGVFGDETPGAVHALGNHPNPFNPATTITFALSATTTTSLRVFDLSGRFVQMLLNEEMLGRGEHELVWSGTDVHGRKMPSGTYFYRLQAGDYTETKRMTMLK
jgi:hypothetical protein